MTWRLAQPDEQHAIEAFLSRHVASSMFLLTNLRDHGLSGTAPKAMKVWLRGAPNNGVAGLTNDGTLLVQAPMATDADWRSMQALVEAQLAGRPQTGVLGATEQLRRYLAATGLAARATRLNRDEPGLALDLGDLDLTCLSRPALAGAALIASSRTLKGTRIALAVLGAALLLTTAIWVRSVTGWLVLPIAGIAILAIARNANADQQRFAIQLLGVQAVISVWAQSGYLFTQGGMLGGMPQISDTGAISAALGLSYWFWAIVLSAINIAILWWSLRYAFRR